MVTVGATVVEDAAAFAIVVVGAIVVVAPAVVVVVAVATVVVAAPTIVVVSSNPFLFADDEPDDPPHADNMSTLVNRKDGRIFI